MNKLNIITSLFFLASCTSSYSSKGSFNTPSWYINQKQNDSENLYGAAEGYTLEESTKYALADAAARLMVTISSESNLIREENSTGANEEMKQQVRQNVEKISFTNFRVTRSDQLGQRFFSEVQVKRQPFINEQKERLLFLERQISDLEKLYQEKNLIQKRNCLLKILDLEKQVELISRILAGSGESVDLNQKLMRIADFQSQLNSISDKIEFYFEIKSGKEISRLIRSSLNKEKIKIAPNRNPNNQNQVTIRIDSEVHSNQIYGAFITKLKVDFENLANGKVVASNSVEVVGSSSIGDKESYFSAIKSLEDKISENGILKIIGIIN